MHYIIVGMVSFILYFLYDYNSVTWKNSGVHRFFFIGSGILVLATVKLIFDVRHYIINGISASPYWLFSFFIFTGLLIYTLFFSLPFDSTYVKQSEKRKVYTKGIYAICRHPGVLWFMGMYFSLFLLTGHPLVFGVATVWSLLNIFYVIFQDCWVFPRTFDDYSAYQKSTPFLIPNLFGLDRKKNQAQERSGL
jgi:protein-S-isoprenylcysteine O-methyltransferase Ste14